MAACVPIIQAVLTSFVLVMNVSLVLLCLLTVRKFIQAQRPNNQSDEAENRKQSSPLIFFAGIVFFFVIAIEAVAFIVRDIYKLSSCSIVKAISSAPGEVARFLHIVQMSALSLVLFVRIYVVFKNSAYRLSECTIRAVIAYFVSWTLFIIAIFIALPLVKDKSVLLSLVGSWQTMTLLYYIWIASFFVYKLFKVYKHSNVVEDTHNHHGMLAVITKNTILAMMSVASTFLFMYALMHFVPRMESAGAFYFFVFTSTLDIYTNFICIAISYKLFDAYYYRFCGLCDRRCVVCCLFIAGKRTRANKAMPADKTVAVSVASDTETTTPRSA